MSKNQLPEIPWKHLWTIDSMDSGKVIFKLSPDTEALPNLAKFLEIEKLNTLQCALKITRKDNGHIFHIHGDITADITQECVHSLEKINTHIEEPFDAYFADRGQAVPFSKAKKELYSKYGMDDLPILDEDEDPEPITDGKIDLGELIVQFLSLSINPYPQIDGTDPQFKEDSIKSNPKRENPFAALKDWNKGKS